MYLLMEYCRFGQIQNTKSDNEIEHNPIVKDIAVSKGRNIWPSKAGQVPDIELAAKWIFHQVAEGMRYMHDEVKIVHRDLKHDNILLGQKMADPYNEDERQPTIKVCDFTTAELMTGTSDEYRVRVRKAGTICFNAPELFNDDINNSLGKPLDVWSYGIMIYVYLTSRFPFDHKVTTQIDVEDQIKNTDYAN